MLTSFRSRRLLPRLEARFHETLRESTMPGLLPVTHVRLMVANDEWRRRGTAALALEQTYLAGPSDLPGDPTSPRDPHAARYPGGGPSEDRWTSE